jgi:hypothetical protein
MRSLHIFGARWIKPLHGVAIDITALVTIVTALVWLLRGQAL